MGGFVSCSVVQHVAAAKSAFGCFESLRTQLPEVAETLRGTLFLRKQI